MPKENWTLIEPDNFICFSGGGGIRLHPDTPGAVEKSKIIAASLDTLEALEAIGQCNDLAEVQKVWDKMAKPAIAKARGVA